MVSEFQVHMLLVVYQDFVDRIFGEGTIKRILVFNGILYRVTEDYGDMMALTPKIL